MRVSNLHKVRPRPQGGLGGYIGKEQVGMRGLRREGPGLLRELVEHVPPAKLTETCRVYTMKTAHLCFLGA